jgi:primary-amine oxidase
VVEASLSTAQQQARETGPTHPLDPLTAAEFGQVAAILRRDRAVGARWRFASVELREPAKNPARAGAAAARREATAVVWNRDDGQAYRAAVSLTGDAVTGWEALPGQQPNITLDEWHECDEMLRDHPLLAAALSRRGITQPDRILTDVWAYGAALVPPRYRGLRLGWSDVWCRASDEATRTPITSAGCTPSWT